MVHMPVMTCAIVVIRRTTGYGDLWGAAFALGSFLLSLGLALVLYARLEDPLRRRLNDLSPFRARRSVAPVPAPVLNVPE